MEGSRKARNSEPPTLALRLKPYKAAIQQLRSVVRTLKDNTTISFLPTPALVIQTVKSHLVSKITFNSSCLYITDKSFQPKTVNNTMPLLNNFMYLTSSKDLTKFCVQDISDLSTRICMCAPDFNMEFNSACVHGQDIVREVGEPSARVDLDVQVLNELLKWITPYTRAKRNAKKQSPPTAVQILIHANPPTIKFSIGGSSELEFTANSRVSFHEVKNIRITVQAKNFYQALLNCSVTKLACTVRILSDCDLMLYVGSRNPTFCVENFITEEPFTRNDVGFEKLPAKSNAVGAAMLNDVGDACGNEDHAESQTVKKHDRRKTGTEHPSSQHKITNYMTNKSSSNSSSGDRGGFFGDAKEESDSDESVTFEFAPSSKKQKCCA